MNHLCDRVPSTFSIHHLRLGLEPLNVLYPPELWITVDKLSMHYGYRILEHLDIIFQLEAIELRQVSAGIGGHICCFPIPPSIIVYSTWASYSYGPPDQQPSRTQQKARAEVKQMAKCIIPE